MDLAHSEHASSSSSGVFRARRSSILPLQLNQFLGRCTLPSRAFSPKIQSTQETFVKKFQTTNRSLKIFSFYTPRLANAEKQLDPPTEMLRFF